MASYESNGIPPKITLYTNHLCPYAQRAHIALKELDLPYEEVIIDLDRPREQWYLDLNPVRGPFQLPLLPFSLLQHRIRIPATSQLSERVETPKQETD
ncbi:hypothetical protein B0A49_09131, partial [Cryomyces minteri]